MDLIREMSDGVAFLKVLGAMTIQHAASFRDEVIEYLSEVDGITIDLTQVADCDAAGIQLLIAARNSASELGKSFNISGVSDSVKDAFFKAGLDSVGDTDLSRGEE